MRALFPSIDVRKLRFRGGWAALPVFVIMQLIYPMSLQQADWVRLSEHFTWIALAGILLGTLIGNGRMRSVRATLLGSALGTWIVLLFTIAAAGEAPIRERALELGRATNGWLTQVLAGEAASDPTVFVVFLGATVWAAAFVGSFALARSGRVWEAILLSGACLTVNISLALVPLLLDLVVFSLCALVLMLRLHIVTLQERWDRQNIQPTGEMDWRVLRGGLTWTAVLVIMALLTPRVGAAEVLRSAFDTFESPYQRVEAEWQRFFAGVSGPSRLKGVSFADSIRLGQSPNLGERVVMVVETGEGHFWRGVTYDFYTGQGWRSTENERADKLILGYLGREERIATFEVLVPHANLLFGANEPVLANVPHQFQTGADRTYSNSIRAVERRHASGRYSIVSSVSVADKQTLRRAPTSLPDHIKQKYLQVPTSLSDRVRELARRVTAGQNTAYDKAEAVETYLRSNYRYSTTIKSPPLGRDPVDFFLFDLKEDFCEYFASSMVMMLREVGVPARMVEGFTTGTFDPTIGRYVVREINAHAWVEVFFPQYGWIEFEPTPSETPFARADAPFESGLGEEGNAPIGEEGFDTDPLSDFSIAEREQFFAESSGALGIGTGAAPPLDPRPALGVLGLLMLVIVGMLVRFEWRFRGFSAVDAAWGKTSLLGSYVGHPPRAAQTTYEYADSLATVVPDASAPLRAIADARVSERYAPDGCTPAQREAAASAWSQVARELVGLLPAQLVRAIVKLLPR